jgi:hypothetical protein
MKPTIDLGDRRVQALIGEFNKRAVAAYEAATTLDEAIQPIYAVLPTSERPTQIGSCVLVTIRDQVFVLSASHVFEPIGQYAVLVACGRKLHPLTGDRFSSARGPSGSHQDDPVDASVLHITCNVPDEIRSAALTVDQCDGELATSSERVFVLSGYRASKSKSSSAGLTSQRERFPSIEWKEADYVRHGLDRNRQVALLYEEQVLVAMKWQTPPRLRGMSGGAILRIAGLTVDPRMTPSRALEAKLTAIMIEQRPREKNRLPVLIGTRIGVHFGLIQQYLPELL